MGYSFDYGYGPADHPLATPLRKLGMPLILILSLPLMLRAEPQDAAVRIPSHGCTGTVIATGPGESWILTCGHAFEGAGRGKAITVDAPAPQAGHARQDKTGIALAKLDYRADLALVRLPLGPLPFVAPVASEPPRPGETLLAVGHAKMGWPSNLRRVRVIDLSGPWLHTLEKPTPGDSGGPVLNSRGEVVGTCTGFEGGPGGRGMYVSLAVIRSFMFADSSPPTGENPFPGGQAWPSPGRR
jgi:hypothetical protein